MPISSAGTVSQFGIRRQRQSVQPAISAGTAANIHTPCFSIGSTTPPGIGRAENQPECGYRGLPSDVRNWRLARVKTSLNCGLC